jgi:hypothetical protein
MALPRPSGPTALWRDLKALAATREPHQWLFLTLSIVVTLAIFFGFAIDYRQAHVVPAPIIYVDSWPIDRSDAQIKKEQKEDSAHRKAWQKERQRQFQKLADDLGIEWR